MEPPQGFREGNDEKAVWKLKKSIYGLKQSGRNWNLMLHEYLVEKGFIQSAVDPCLYTRKTGETTVMMLVWVDDILIAGTNEECIDEVKCELKLKFKMSDFGKLSYFLGIQFKFEGNSVKMTQSLYLQKILERFGMQDCKPRKTPCDPNLHFSESDDTIVDVTLYRELIGSLIYAMTCTRPDICWIVSKGRKACVGMKLIQYKDNDALHKPAIRGAQVYAVEGALISKAAITEKYATVFGDGIGELEGEYRIRLDDTVDPIQHAPRRVPVALRDRLKTTLDDMVRVRVDQLDGRNHEERQQSSHLSRSEGSKSRDPARKLPATDD